MTLFSEEVDEKTMKNGLRMSRGCGKCGRPFCLRCVYETC